MQEPNFFWLLAFNSFLAYFTNLTNFLVCNLRRWGIQSCNMSLT